MKYSFRRIRALADRRAMLSGIQITESGAVLGDHLGGQVADHIGGRCPVIMGVCYTVDISATGGWADCLCIMHAWHECPHLPPTARASRPQSPQSADRDNMAA